MIDGSCPECGSDDYDRHRDESVVRCESCGFESGPLSDGGKNE